MAFDEAKEIETLDYKFGSTGIHGTVPEPTDDDLRRFNSAQRKAIRDVTGDDFDPTDNVALTRLFSRLTDEQLEQMDEATLDAVASVCKGHPTRDELVQVGPRARRKFVAWLNRELNGGEGSAPVTKP